MIVDQIVQRDDGAWSIGLAADAAGPFPSRQFAEAVVASEMAKAFPERAREVRNARTT